MSRSVLKNPNSKKITITREYVGGMTFEEAQRRIGIRYPLEYVEEDNISDDSEEQEKLAEEFDRKYKGEIK